MDKNVEKPSKVWKPDGSIMSQLYISSTEDHLGNKVAEGDITKEEYYPLLCADYKRRFERVREEAYEFKKKVEKRMSDEAYKHVWEYEYLNNIGV